MELTSELMSIGQFARLSGLTVKALRHYDEIGMLEPARVDPDTGYRWYSLEQARDAEAIRRLRRLEVPLDEIRSLLGASAKVLRERLRVHVARLEGRAVELQEIRSELQRLIDGKEELVPEQVNIRFELKIEQLAEQHVLSVKERAHVDELSTVVPRGIAQVHAYLEELGLGFAGPPICICPHADEDGMSDVEMAWPVAEPAPGRPPIEARTLPAVRALVLKHTGPYTELSRSYRLMCEVMERNGLTSAGAPREVYLSDPNEVADPNDYETLIAWPIGPEGELEESRDVFKRRVPAP